MLIGLTLLAVFIPVIFILVYEFSDNCWLRTFGPSSINLNSRYETSCFFVCLNFCAIANMELGSTNSPKQKIKPLD